jgi:PIN domain nuclease of toxin-antitoxin system
MTSVLLDTHTWAWALSNDARLSAQARVAMTEADVVFVSPVSLFEIGQKVRIGKWPEMSPYVIQLPSFISEQGALVAALTPDVALFAAVMNWTHRDPFDRLLAATAIHTKAAIISADAVFDELAGTEGWRGRVW